MKILRYLTILALLSLLLIPTVAYCQDQPPEKGSIEFGIRHVWGNVYGRPDLPFHPDVITSKFNEYSDRRNGMFIRRMDFVFDDVLGSKNYVALQSLSSFYKNQSYLATFGRYGKFKVQFRYDEIPHVYTNTTRTIFTETTPGVFTVPLALKTALQTQSSTGTSAAIGIALPGYISNQAACAPPMPPATVSVACSSSFITPRILRKAGTGTVSYNFNADWLIFGMFSRESQVGHRPIGIIMNSSPSASASGQPSSTTAPVFAVSNRQSPGTGAEVPEPIDYFTNSIKVMTEFGKKNWAFQAGYTGSFFENRIGLLLVDNPFATADVPVQLIAPSPGVCAVTGAALNCTISAIPARALMDLYPDNTAHYLNFAAAIGLGKHLNLMGTINPGWLRQNDAFVPYTSNTAITGLTALPASSLNGKKQTLAMNWTLVGDIFKNVQLAAKYRHYDYNNNTEERVFTPVQGDVIGANSTATGQTTPGPADSLPFGFNKKTVEFTGNWFFAKRSSVKLGYEGEWFDRKHRDAAHSKENSFIAAVDLSPWKEFLFRLAYRHSDRKPDEYQDEMVAFNNLIVPCSDTTTVGFTSEQRCHRRFDEAARILNRADITLQYDWKDFTFTAGFQTMQNDFNRAGGTNSATPLNFLTGAAAKTSPYYLYGAQKDISNIYTFDASYTISPAASVFAEYTRENYYKRMISRYRSPTSGVQTILTCNGCDTANNDWESSYSDIFDTYSAGLDLFLAKKVYVTAFYSLSDGKGRIPSRFLGDPTILAPATTNRFVLVGGTAAVPYPQSNTRIHELALVFKYKLTKNLMPKLEYRLQQFDNEDAQTSVMFPFMGCMSPAPPGAAVTGCPTQLMNSGSSSNPVLSPNGTSSFYPGFRAGDTSAARYIFLGADQPSYRIHIFTASLEYRF